MSTFGPEFTKALLVGCSDLKVPPEWVLAVLALESGFKLTAANPSGARGLWQKMPDMVSQTWPQGKALPPGHFQKANGSVWRYYDVSKPAHVQLEDAFRFWRNMQRTFSMGAWPSRAAFYCTNLYPATLRGGKYNDDTVLFAKGTKAYEQNAGLDYRKRGFVCIDDLDRSLERAVKNCQARYNAELGAAMVANISG